MDLQLEKILKRELDKAGMSHLYEEQTPRSGKRKRAFENPYDNSSWANMLDGALKGLEFVALMSFDWKLTGIVKLLQSWIEDKQIEQAEAERIQEYGANYDLTHTPNSPNDTGFGGYY